LVGVSTTKVYSGIGADIVMESIALIEQQSNLLTFVDEDARTKEVKLRKNEKPLP